MSYTPIGWQTGDTITADKLNKMDPGWGVSSTQFFSETVTTADTGQGFPAGNLTYVFQSGPPETAVITFDGTDYTCDFNGYGYGEAGESGPDFTTYPFFLVIQSGEMGRTIIYTSTVGEHTVALSATGTQVSDSFIDAVNQAIDISKSPFLCVNGVTTYDEMNAARESNRLLYFYSNSICHFITNFYNQASATAVDALPAGVSGAETYGFNSNMIFTIFMY